MLKKKLVQHQVAQRKGISKPPKLSAKIQEEKEANFSEKLCREKNSDISDLGNIKKRDRTASE